MKNPLRILTESRFFVLNGLMIISFLLVACAPGRVPDGTPSNASDNEPGSSPTSTPDGSPLSAPPAYMTA